MTEYKKHNFVSNYGYEIYRPDGTLRKRYMPEPEASCEGTLDLEIKDQKGEIKQKDSVPIRSLQRGIIAQIFSSTPGSSTSSESAYRFQNRWFYTPAQGSNPQRGSNIAASGSSMFGGIFVCNQSSSGTSKYCSYVGSDNIDQSFVSMSSVSDHLHYDSATGGTIKISLTRSNVQPNSGSASRIALVGNSGTAPGYVYAMDSLSSSWAQNDSIRITYNFEFPTSSSSTINRNMLVDWFTNFDTSMRLKNLSGTEIAPKNTNPSLTICGCKYIYGASADQIDKGIVLGSSDADVNWEDTNLNSVFDVNVLKPTATSAADFTGEQISGSTVYCQHARNFQNISDSAVTIKEAGVITHPTNTTYCVASADSFLLAHWLTGDVVVNPGETIRVYWKPTIIVD